MCLMRTSNDIEGLLQHLKYTSDLSNARVLHVEHEGPKPITEQLLRAALWLQMSICSRDVKLENTLIDKPDDPSKAVIKLCDFGYSINEMHSLPQSAVGTPGYTGTPSWCINDMHIFLLFPSFAPGGGGGGIRPPFFMYCEYYAMLGLLLSFHQTVIAYYLDWCHSTKHVDGASAPASACRQC